MAYWTTSGEFVFMVILGGLGHVAAAFIGAGVLSAVQAVAYAVAPNNYVGDFATPSAGELPTFSLPVTGTNPGGIVPGTLTSPTAQEMKAEA